MFTRNISILLSIVLLFSCIILESSIIQGLEKPYGLHAGKKKVFIFDGSSYSYKIYSLPDLKKLGEFGRKGEGPGEFRGGHEVTLLNNEIILCGDFTITPDGQRMVFASRKFIKEIGQRGEGANIWTVDFNNNVWSTPVPLGSTINTIHHDRYPCLSSNQNMYFFSRKLGGFGEDDLYISFKMDDGHWSKPVHMGDKINSPDSENRPYISPDGKYLFYAGIKGGNRDIYWVSAKIIKYLNK